MIDKFNFKELLPHFSSFSFPLDTLEELSTVFAFILLAIFLGFLLFSIKKFLKSLTQISWVINLMKDETSSSLASSRQNFIDESKKVTHQGRHLWWEFNETLIETENEGVVRLHNTLDADHFFNTSKLAAGITESRMLAAVPGFLTAVGVIGTFVGLQQGLSGLNIGGEVDEMMRGIAHVISGAKTAFLTSVWGVFLSVLFNIIEKELERRIRTKIHNLQIRIDELFPRFNADYQLHRIANDGQQSRESLQGLGEKIGEKLQEALVETTKTIQGGLESSLEKIMAPAINKLVDETSSGNQRALESLIENFLSKFGELGSTQRDAMDQASHKVSDALSSLNSSMTTFLNRLEVSQSNSAGREKELITTISDQVTQLIDHSNEQRKLLSEFVDNQLSNLNEVFQEREKNVSERDQHRQEIFIEQNNAIKSSTEALLKRVEDGLDAQLATSELLIEQGKILQAGIDDSVKASILTSDNLKVSANEINSASQKIGTLGSQLTDAGDSLSGAILKAVESTSELAHQNVQASELVKQQREQLILDKQQFMESVERLQSLINSADSSFDKMREHQDSFLSVLKENVNELDSQLKENVNELDSQLKENVNELASQMTTLLSDYASQANSQTERHLNVWSEHTTNYAEQMNRATQTLSTVVDEIEGKLGG